MPRAGASSIIPAMAAHPERLGKYEIRREIGKGSMGVVYEAYDPVIQRRVAIKMIRRDDFGATRGTNSSRGSSARPRPPPVG